MYIISQILTSRFGDQTVFEQTGCAYFDEQIPFHDIEKHMNNSVLRQTKNAQKKNVIENAM